jgi:eukaryotic-like serine/threonine-protein kinase
MACPVIRRQLYRQIAKRYHHNCKIQSLFNREHLMNCPRCNNPLANNAKFCPQCGLAITGEFNEQNPGAPAQSAQATFDLENSQTLIAPLPPVATDPMLGRVIEGKYEIVSRLGEGGMGAVYRAKRLRIGDQVAIKILHHKFLTETGALERFRREAQAAAMIHHPNVVAIYDAGEEPQNNVPAFIVMELVAGEPLRDILSREKRLPCVRAVALIQQACAGISAAHRQKIVHRDIKPDNFIVLPPHSEDEHETLKVLDFGIAKLRDMVGTATLTQTGIVMGTPYYMSPEQCKGESLDSRSDVYSLGATLYEMLAGKPPFTAPTPTGIVAKHLTEPPPAMPQGAGVLPALEAVIQRSLAKHPDARQADASAFARELQTALATGMAPPGYVTPSTGTAPWGSAGHPAGVQYPQTQPQNFGVMTHPSQMAQTGGQGYLTTQQKPSNKRAIINVAALVIFLAAASAALWWIFKGNKTIVSENQNASLAYEKSGNSSAQSAAAAPPGDINSTANKNSINSININKNAANGNASTKPANPSGELPIVDDTPPDVPPPPLTPFTGSLSVAEKKILAGAALTDADIEGIAAAKLRLLRNTVYARHGRKFDSPDLQKYFSAKEWYEPRDDYQDSMLTASDRKNVDLLVAAEKRRR